MFLIVLCICAAAASAVYASDYDSCKIRGIASRKNEQLYNEMAIDLFNGKSRFVNLDDMVKILTDYNIVEFGDEHIRPTTKEIILREVAFRMLKENYLPRLDDKISIYNIGVEHAKDNRIGYSAGLGAVVTLPVKVAAIKDEVELRAIYWPGLTMQISSAIEKLLLKRVRYSCFPSDDTLKDLPLLQAAALLRKEFMYGSMHEPGAEVFSDNEIAEAIGKKIESWLREGSVSRSDLPVLSRMTIQYMILSSAKGFSGIISEFKDLRGIDDLRIALMRSIKNTTESIKDYNPSDYGLLIMFQGLLDGIPQQFLSQPNKPSAYPANIDFQENRHSA